jgi:hypothetical protein
MAKSRKSSLASNPVFSLLEKLEMTRRETTLPQTSFKAFLELPAKSTTITSVPTRKCQRPTALRAASREQILMDLLHWDIPLVSL